jgi:hypothetical protein
MKRCPVNILILLLLVLGGTWDVHAEQRNPGEYQVKALFIYNFINFVEWPADSSFSSNSTVNVCIVGDDPFNEAFDEIRNETVKGKRLVIKPYHTSEERKGCQVLFIPASEGRRAESILRTVRDTGALTVGDTEEAARQGAVIGFYMEQKKVRFAINMEAAKRAGFKISSKLLKLAKIVRSE